MCSGWREGVLCVVLEVLPGSSGDFLCYCDVVGICRWEGLIVWCLLKLEKASESPRRQYTDGWAPASENIIEEPYRGTSHKLPNAAAASGPGIALWEPPALMYLPMQEMQEMRVWSLGQEDPLEKEMATHCSILAWKIPWTEDPGKL